MKIEKRHLKSIVIYKKYVKKLNQIKNVRIWIEK